MPRYDFGRIPPTDDKHLKKFPLTMATTPIDPSPPVFGINWYRGFQRDMLIEKNGMYFFPPQSKWGSVEGGHAICGKIPNVRDLTSWWVYHDQIGGSCTGWSSGRAATTKNREKYGCQKIYEHAQRIDEWTSTPPEEGSSVRAAMEVLRTVGPYDLQGVPHAEDGISAYRWGGSVEDVARAMSPSDGGVKILNSGRIGLLQSWGTYYPHIVYMTLDDAYRLVFREDGEVAFITDR